MLCTLKPEEVRLMPISYKFRVFLSIFQLLFETIILKYYLLDSKSFLQSCFAKQLLWVSSWRIDHEYSSFFRQAIIDSI